MYNGLDFNTGITTNATSIFTNMSDFFALILGIVLGFLILEIIISFFKKNDDDKKDDNNEKEGYSSYFD